MHLRPICSSFLSITVIEIDLASVRPPISQTLELRRDIDKTMLSPAMGFETLPVGAGCKRH
jgi:hypothetical protein